MTGPSRADAEALDAEDPLAFLRERFSLAALVGPESRNPRIYFDGNSLGPLPLGVKERVSAAVEAEWGDRLIAGWNDCGWMDLPQSVAARIAPLVGAAPQAVIATDSTSVNLFKTLSAALQLQPDRKVVVSERGNFPTDLYVAETLLAGLGGALRLIDDAETELAAALSAGDVGVVMLTQIDYRTGRKLDMASVTDSVHRQGALMLWDLAHSAGAFAVNLDEAGADFAVGCGYKFLNGGPGAPAFLYVAERHQGAAIPLLAGWMGHRQPFSFQSHYEPAEGIGRFRVGTPPVLSLTALDAALRVFDDVDTRQITAKAARLTSLFIDCVEPFAADHGLTLASPRDAVRRGAQVSYRSDKAYAVIQALINVGVVGDFRDPNIARFGFPATYLRHVDVWEAVQRLHHVLDQGLWKVEAEKPRRAVT